MDKTFQHTVSWYQLSLKFHISMLLSALVEQREKIKSPTFLVSTQVIKWISTYIQLPYANQSTTYTTSTLFEIYSTPNLL